MSSTTQSSTILIIPAIIGLVIFVSIVGFISAAARRSRRTRDSFGPLYVAPPAYVSPAPPQGYRQLPRAEYGYNPYETYTSRADVGDIVSMTRITNSTTMYDPNQPLPPLPALAHTPNSSELERRTSGEDKRDQEQPPPYR